MKTPTLKISSASLRKAFGINKTMWGLLSIVVALFVLIFTTVPSSPPPNIPDSGLALDSVVVNSVVDGDTIEILAGKDKYKLRFIGVNTPETVKPNSPVECFGKEASAFNKQLLEKKTVYLEKDVSETDSFGRLLRYVYLKDDAGNKNMVNEILVKEGYAYASSYPPDIKYQEKFRELEREARDAKRGLWAACPKR
jgi:micrococcal nuclease